jgi:hypothetical protein
VQVFYAWSFIGNVLDTFEDLYFGDCKFGIVLYSSILPLHLLYSDDVTEYLDVLSLLIVLKTHCLGIQTGPSTTPTLVGNL